MGPQRGPEEGPGPRMGWGSWGEGREDPGWIVRSWWPSLGWPRRQKGRTLLSCFRPKTDLKALAYRNLL